MDRSSGLSRDRKAIGLLVIIIVLLLLPIGYYLNYVLVQGSSSPCIGQIITDGCNDINQFVPASEYNGTGMINVIRANNTAMNGTIPSYAQVMKQNNTIVFHSMNDTILVFANANTWVSYVTNTTVPNYDNVSQYSNGFAIYHMYQPSLVIPRGATLNVTLVNMDYGDHHNFVLTTFGPPFPMYIMQNMNMKGEMVAMTPLIPPVDNTSNTALSNANASVFSYTILLNVPKGTVHMWYMCMFPTHAMQGMYGNITIVDPKSVGA